MRLGLHRANRFAVEVEEVVGEPESALHREPAHRDATTGGELDVVAILHEPPGGGEIGVDLATRSVFGGLRHRSFFPGSNVVSDPAARSPPRALVRGRLDLEAVVEDLGVKQALFDNLDEICAPGTVLATTTSSLPVIECAMATSRPGDVIGMHFFNPVHRMKLLEVVCGAKTADDVLLTVMRLAKKIGKTAVVSGVCDGFIGNRMLEQYLRQAMFLLEEGASPAQVDQALERFGMAMGPFRMSDLAGNDVGWYIRKRRYVEKPTVVYSRIADRLGSQVAISSHPIVVNPREGGVREAIRTYVREAPRMIERTAGESAPRSWAKVPYQTRWLIMRNSSDSITRITWARGGILMPASVSTAIR